MLWNKIETELIKKAAEEINNKVTHTELPEGIALPTRAYEIFLKKNWLTFNMDKDEDVGYLGNGMAVLHNPLLDENHMWVKWKNRIETMAIEYDENK